MAAVSASSPGAQRTVQGRLDSVARWAIPVCGRWYLHVVTGVTILMAVVLTAPMVNISLVPLWTGGYGKTWYILVFALITLITAPVGLPLVVLPRHWALVRYLRGEEVDPADVWRACVTRVPFSIWATGIVWAGLVSVLGVAWVAPREDFTFWTYAGSFGAHVLLCSAVGTFYFTIYEVALLPIAHEVAAQLPPDFAERNAITGRRRLMLLNTTITLAMGCAAAGLSYGFPEGRDRIWAVVLVTALLMGTFCGLLLALVSSSVTRRVDELADALNDVGRGGPAVRLLPTSGDEFDAVGSSYNSMVELLEAHADDLRTSRARLVAVADRTRRSIERDLHDGAQQNLALLSLQLGQLERASQSDPDLGERVRRLRADLTEVVAEMRSLAHGIYPASLEAEGLTSALRAAAREVGVHVDLQLEVGGERWVHSTEVAIYFCCWELVQRARNAEVPGMRVGISINEVDDWAVLTLTAGRLPEQDQVADLERFLQDRLGAVGGALAVVDAEDGGLAFVGSVPIR